ncbi:class D beta-lactamase [Mycoplana rhizolycopersici]|uniref:Beta-lactamase n=1 Tax=Mycoplana rhizolycopersici TaxID=2746702 RepID=A0ABX2QEC6_9HYPH|nr:class D beta-lactamase [Rhizobium rhizolycopersici]NVP55292.1 class D beta-lactamase [Rhizobium rhizolycopersici]
MKKHIAFIGFMAAWSLASSAEAKTICTVIADAKSHKTIVEEGNCAERFTPASTFKVALSLIGYDSGFLEDEHTPKLPFRDGYADWGGDNWKQPTDAQRWMKYSVVWFSQVMAHSLGEQKLRAYATKFDYGNADFSGDPGKDNGLDRAWISSSLKISPLEQVAFLRRLVNRQLPVSDHAFDMTMKVVEKTELAGGWSAQGKTGMAYPRQADGTLDYDHPWGWYVGWATKGDRTVVFARLVQEEKRQKGSAGARVRDMLFNELPSLVVAQ